MKSTFGIAVLLIIASASCVDRIKFDLGDAGVLPVIIDGYISDQPGPYEVRVSKAYDTEGKSSFKTPLTVRGLTISDNLGNSEKLVRIDEGIYRTQPGGIRGVVGRAYKLNVELLDGRAYESVPDTLYASGGVDKVYYEFITEKAEGEGTKYAFDLYFDSKAADQSNFRFLWKRTGTYQVDTNPELYEVVCAAGRCPAPLPCSSYILDNGGLEDVKPCDCCSCWVKTFNEIPIVSDDELVKEGKFTHVSAGRIPITQWIFMYKIHIEVEQFSLSTRSFSFWKAVKAQMQATESLFQPLTGKIPNNFVQVSGETGNLEGIFYATSIKKNAIFIRRSDVPNQGVIPPQDLPFKDSCLKFDNSSNVRPSFWDQ